MMKIKILLLTVGYLSVLSLGAVRPCFALPPENDILVSAASSLTDALKSLQPEAEQTIGASILFNFGGSGTLRKQIEEGAPVDLFFSAASQDMDKLERMGLLLGSSRVDILANTLVLIGGSGSSPVAGTAELRNLLKSAALLAIGNPDSVPAGRYAAQALRSMGLLGLVEGRLVRGGSVREVLQFVQSGSAPFGIVFLTDVLSLPAGGDTRLVYKVPPEYLDPAIVYPAAVIAGSKNPTAALKLLNFLRGNAARKIFEKAGFMIK